MSNPLKLKKIWHDPVWSKVIADQINRGIACGSGLIVAVFGVIYAFFPAARKFLGASALVPHWALVVLSVALLLLAIMLAVARRAKTQSRSVDSGLKITQIDVWIAEDKRPNISFPLKVYCEMQNDSNRAVDVRLCPYIPDAVKVTRFTRGALQLKFPTGWLPQPDGLERVAVHPGQTFKAWVAPDETRFTKVTLEGLRGRIGTLVLDVDGQTIDMPL
jgi:hypothetical protein